MALRARFTVPQIEILTACIQTYLSVEAENRALTPAKFQIIVAERIASLELDLPEDVSADLLDMLDFHAGLRQVA